MKQVVKKLIIALIEKINLNHLLSELSQKKHLADINNQIINHGAFFYPEAVVSNGREKSNIVVGKGTHIRGMLNVFKYGGQIDIGEGVYIGDHSRVWSGEQVKVGDFVLISHNVNIMDTNAHELDAIERTERSLDLFKNGAWADKGDVKTAPVVIKDYAWICFNATILKGVTIGEGAIVAANALVAKDVPDYTMVAGNPARIVKTLEKK